MATVIKTSGQPVEVDPSGSGGAGSWATVLIAGNVTGARSPALSAGQAFVDANPGDGWRLTTQPGPAGVAGPLTFFTMGDGAAGQFGGTFAGRTGATVGGGSFATWLYGSSSPTRGAGFAWNAGAGVVAGVGSGQFRFGTTAPGAGGLQGDWAVTGPGAMLGVQARAAMPANVNATQGGYWGLISGPSSVPMYRDNVGTDRQLQYNREQSFQAVANNTATVLTAADVNFHAVPGAAFAESAASTAFALGAADCIATYGGTLTKRFLVRVVVASRATVGAGDSEFNGCVAVNGDVIGTAVGSQVLNGEVNVNHTLAAADDLICQAVYERIVTLATGDTVQPAIGRFSGTAVTINVDWLTMTVTEVN